MDTKGSKTRRRICAEAYGLFARKGYKDVTMQDICECTGLSRGGLYRHFQSTEEIFLSIIHAFTSDQQKDISEGIRQDLPAAGMLSALLSKYEEEMLDSESSLSLAIYEFYSDPARAKGENQMQRQYELSKAAWMDLIHYGMSTGAFKAVDPEAVFDMVVFAYQGVRMYSRLMELDPAIPARLVGEIKKMLIRKL